MKGFLLVLLLLIPWWEDSENPHYPLSDNPPVCQAFGHYGHVGVDFNVPVGTRVYAVLDGEVVVTAEDSRVYGRFVMILHDDGYASLYAHLSKIEVKKGSHIRGGRLIGLSGGDPRDQIDGDGWSSGAHLHFEVRVPEHLENNLYNTDPMLYIESYFKSCAEFKYPCI